MKYLLLCALVFLTIVIETSTMDKEKNFIKISHKKESSPETPKNIKDSVPDTNALPSNFRRKSISLKPTEATLSSQEENK